MNALTAVLARENPGLIINACCPGWVSTDSKHSASQLGDRKGYVHERHRAPSHVPCTALTSTNLRSG